MSLITYLTRIHFADRVLEDALSEELARHGINRPLVISDTGSFGGDGFDRLLCALPHHIRATDHVAGRQPAKEDRAAADTLLTDRECDGIIGFGGLAALDLARVVANRRLPVLAIPTGTETVGLGPLGRRVCLLPGQQVDLPKAILLDATLTMGADPETTAAAGMDALCHCLECFLGTAYNPPAEGIALDGLCRAARHLEAAVQAGNDVTARREMLAAALDAGLASAKGYGGIEAASHGLAEITQTRRGVLRGALLQEILAFNAPAVSDRYEPIRRMLGFPAGSDPGERLVALAERVGLPLRLSDMGIEAHMLRRAAQCAAADPANRTNPRHATDRDYERIMRAVL